MLHRSQMLVAGLLENLRHRRDNEEGLRVLRFGTMNPQHDTSAEYLGGLRALLGEQRFAVLGTCQPDGAPYASLVGIAAAPDLRLLLFATGRATRKYANLLHEPRVSLLIDNRQNTARDLQRAMAATALGTAHELQGEERGPWAERLLARHPALAEFVASPGTALFRVDLRCYYVVTRFRSVIEVHVDRGGLSVADPTP